MQPVVCNKDMAVVFPLKDGDCEFWLEIVDSVDDITNPSRDHAYVDSKGLFYIYNGKEIQVINDHTNLKIKWGNMIGDISNQLDLIEILNQFVKTISVNGTNIAKDNDKNIAIQVPITTIKLDGNTISPVDYIVNLDLASVYAKKNEIPKNVSELQNDAGYIKQEVVDQLIPIKAIKVNNVTIPPDENHAVNIENVYITPEMFGAVGDGVTDDSRAFTECFDTANANHKYILLSNKMYLICNTLTNISNTNIIGVNTVIILCNNTFTKQIFNCVFSNITFKRTVSSDLPLTENFYSSQFKYCNFVDINYLFNNISPRTNMLEHLLLDGCKLQNTQLISATNEFNGVVYSINKTLFYYDEDYKQRTAIISGYIGGKFIFNNCTFSKFESDGIIELFGSLDNFEFNNCYIHTYDNANTFILPNISSVEKQQITFNNCDISNNNKYLVDVYSTNNTVLPTVNIKYSTLKVNAIFNAKNECSLWLENNQIDTKPIINAGVGKVNIVEVQQKYSDTSENIFPWATEPTPTVENNVSINSAGAGDYYVLTENEDKTIKKLDYYFKQDYDYLPVAPYCSNNIFVKDLDLEGYTVKNSQLSNTTCKLKNKSTGELIDYVYLMLDNDVTVTTEHDPQLVYTEIAVKYLPYFAKLKTDTPVAGRLYINMCVSIILEKTSS
nr:MAG TPA: tailspike protein [Bacteriophage sp.]